MTHETLTNETLEEKLAEKNQNQNRDYALWTGIVLTILGVVAIALPVISTIFAETWVALILFTAGGAKVLYAYQTRREGNTVWKGLLGALYAVTGVMLLVYPRTGVLTLTLLLGSFLLTEGVFELIFAWRLRPRQNWTWALGNAIVTLILGGMIWFQFPFNAPWILGTLLGASILLTGISRIGLSLKRRDLLPDGDSPTSA